MISVSFIVFVVEGLVFFNVLFIRLHIPLNPSVDWSPPEGLLTTISRTTRGHSQKLRVPHSRTNSHLHSFFPSATRLWNSLPAKATTAGSIAAFRNITEGWLGAST